MCLSVSESTQLLSSSSSSSAESSLCFLSTTFFFSSLLVLVKTESIDREKVKVKVKKSKVCILEREHFNVCGSSRSAFKSAHTHSVSTHGMATRATV